MDRTDVAIVGAGPYGLSIAAHLAGRVASLRIFGEPMSTWRDHMPAGMSLKSDGFASNLYDPAGHLTLEAYCLEKALPYAPIGWPVPLETFVAYGRWFQERAVPTLERRWVEAIARGDGDFVLTLDHGQQVSARRLVLAMGVAPFPYVPEALARLPATQVTHSSEHANPAAFAGKDVTVLGAGASALDLAALLHEAGATVRVVARARVAKFHSHGLLPRPLLERIRRPRSGLGVGWPTFLLTHFPGAFRHLPDGARVQVVRRVLGPSAGWSMRQRVEGKVLLLLGHEIGAAAVVGDQLELTLAGPDGAPTTLRTDHLIAATGYRVDVSRLQALAPELAANIALVDGSPRLDGQFQSSAPGLFFVGLAAANTFGPLQRFAYGARFAARQVARALT